MVKTITGIESIGASINLDSDTSGSPALHPAYLPNRAPISAESPQVFAYCAFPMVSRPFGAMS